MNWSSTLTSPFVHSSLIRKLGNHVPEQVFICVDILKLNLDEID